MTVAIGVARAPFPVVLEQMVAAVVSRTFRRSFPERWARSLSNRTATCGSVVERGARGAGPPCGRASRRPRRLSFLRTCRSRSRPAPQWLSSARSARTPAAAPASEVAPTPACLRSPSPRRPRLDELGRAPPRRPRGRARTARWAPRARTSSSSSAACRGLAAFVALDHPHVHVSSYPSALSRL